MTYTLTYSQTLVTESCCNCGIQFAMPEDFQRQARNDHRLFYCPSGHSQHYVGKTDAEKAREEAERLRRQLASRDEDIRVERQSHAATKGQLTKAKKRADAGVCQHCHRTFQQVSAHVARQHPEVVA